MRIGLVKPHWGPRGGFERLLERIVGLLAADGHTVDEVPLAARFSPRPVWGRPEAVDAWPEHPEFYHYLALAEEVRNLSLRRFDVVLATQPPTFLADHPRVVTLFYHQHRIFYDLAEPFAALGQIDPELHVAAAKHIQAFDRQWIGGVGHWLAGSPECAGRLGAFWDVPDSKISLLHAPALTTVNRRPPRWSADGPVVCVSRHEWPKRTELMVAAAHLLDTHRVWFIGGGGRLESCQRLDAYLVRHPEMLTPGHPDAPPEDRWGLDPMAAFRDEDLGGESERAGGLLSGVQLLGEVSDVLRNQAYATASVVVAPAFHEDYGLTVLEAMLWHRPVIVCEDGGGLVDLVNDTGAGLVVEPTPAAIADGIQRIRHDTALRSRLITAAQAVSSTFTWERARDEVRAALAQV